MNYFDDEERDGREAADGGFVAGEGDDAGVVGELETEVVAGIGFARDVEGAEEGEDFAEEFAGLAEEGGEGEGVGDVEGLIDGADGGSGGFAPSTGAVDEDVSRCRIEDLPLAGVGMEEEFGGDPEGGREDGCWADRGDGEREIVSAEMAYGLVQEDLWFLFSRHRFYPGPIVGERRGGVGLKRARWGREVDWHERVLGCEIDLLFA